MKKQGVAYILRHMELEEMDDEGWVALSTVSNLLSCKPDELIQNAKEDTKGRYDICETTKRIRARYGHSVELPKPAWIMSPVLPEHIDMHAITQLFHATTYNNWQLIQKDGYVRPMKRMAIHFALEKEHTRQHPVMLILDVYRAMASSIKLYWGSMHIIVCPQNIPIDLFDVF